MIVVGELINTSRKTIRAFVEKRDAESIKKIAREQVEAGATLLVMEAMKMEHAIKAPHDGRIKAYRFNPGDQVKDGDLLVEFEEVG